MASSSARQWWKRAAATLKDRRTVYLSQITRGGQRAEMEAAVIRATSHDERSIDYKNAARVFAWARTSPALLAPLLRSLARRAARTRSWAVALKTLLLAHGILLASPAAAARLGRLPFDLSEFRDHSVSSSGFSAFVRAYFQFLDCRSAASSDEPELEALAKMQALLELLMRVRPYSDGMEVGLILEAMNCVIIEIFEVWGSICRGIAGFLVDVVGSDKSVEERRRIGLEGMKVVRRAAEQSRQLSAFFGLCRGLGVLNAAEIPPVESVAEEDICEIEACLENLGKGKEERRGRFETVVTEDWEVFEDDDAVMGDSLVNCSGELLCSLKDEVKPEFLRLPWVATICNQAAPPFAGGNLIEMISRSMY